MSPVGSDKGVLHRMPSGAAAWYVEEDHEHPTNNHSYWRHKEDGTSGRRFTGVTTVTKVFDIDPENLIRWGAKTNGTGIAILASDGLALDTVDEIRDALAWLNSADAIWRALEESKLTYADVRDERGTVGTNVHELAFQALAKGEPVPDYEGLSTEERGYAKGVVQFWLDTEPEAEQVEQVLVDDALGIAGRTDFRGTLGAGSYAGKGHGVVDAKTGRYVMPAHHVQVALYALLAELCGFGSSNWTALLHLHGDGSYTLVPGQATREDALAAVDLYRRHARIVSAERKARAVT